MPNTITLIKLINGEKVIGYVDDSQLSRNPVRMTHPMAVLEKELPDGLGGVILSKYNPYVSATYTDFKTEQVMHVTQVSETMAIYYKKSLEYDEKLYNEMFSASIGRVTEYLTNVLADLSKTKKPEEEAVITSVDQPTVNLAKKRVRAVEVHPGSNTVN